MRAEYKRDMNHNYLILSGDQEVDTSSYQVRMLAGNVLPSILKCRLQGLDGKILFYYEITSRQSLASIYEQKKLGLEDLQLIFGGFVQAMEEMAEYLLNPGQLVLDPDYIFIDVEKRSLFFCYLPGYEREVREQFQAFTEYILPKMDHEDNRAVILGYGVYRRALEDSFHLEHIKQELYQIKDVSAAENLRQEDMHIGKEKNCVEVPEITGTDLHNIEIYGNGMRESVNIPSEMKNDINNKKNSKTKNSSVNHKQKKVIHIIIGTVAAVGIMIGILTANLLGYLPWLSVEITMAAGVFLLGAGVLAYMISRKKIKKEEENWREKVEKKPEKVVHKEPPEENQWPVEEGKDAADVFTVQKTGDFGETMVLSANSSSGSASLVSREPGELATIFLEEELTIIGKLDTACDAVIPLPTVSRVHGKIRKRGEEYYLSDLNSRNGTSVNGRLLKGNEEYQLQDEDEVDFAQARYIFLAR